MKFLFSLFLTSSTAFAQESEPLELLPPSVSDDTAQADTAQADSPQAEEIRTGVIVKTKVEATVYIDNLEAGKTPFKRSHS